MWRTKTLTSILQSGCTATYHGNKISGSWRSNAPWRLGLGCISKLLQKSCQVFLHKWLPMNRSGLFFRRFGSSLSSRCRRRWASSLLPGGKQEGEKMFTLLHFLLWNNYFLAIQSLWESALMKRTEWTFTFITTLRIKGSYPDMGGACLSIVILHLFKVNLCGGDSKSDSLHLEGWMITKKLINN